MAPSYGPLIGEPEEEQPFSPQQGSALPPATQGGLPFGASSPAQPKPVAAPSFQRAPLTSIGGNVPDLEQMLAERLQTIQGYQPGKSNFDQQLAYMAAMKQIPALTGIANIRSQERQLAAQSSSEIGARLKDWNALATDEQERQRKVYSSLFTALSDRGNLKIDPDTINEALTTPDLSSVYADLLNDPLVAQQRQGYLSRLSGVERGEKRSNEAKLIRSELDAQVLAQIQSALPQVVAQIRGPSQEPLDMQTFLTNPQVKQMLDQSPTLKRVFNAYVLDEKNAKTLERIGLATSLEGPPMSKELSDFVGKMYSGPGGKPITNTPRLITSEMLTEAKKAQMAFDIRKSAEAGLTTAQFMLTMPAPAKERMEHADVTALVERGDVIPPPPGTTVGALRTGPYAHMSDTQKKALTTLKPSRTAFSDMNVLADRLITATTWQEAIAQGIRLHGSAISGADPEAAAYRKAQPAVTSFLARLVESGVMTNEDIDRWKAAATASFFDTKQSNTIRRAVMSDVLNTAEQALISQVAGVPMKKPQALRELLNRMDQATQETLKHTRAGLPPGARIIRGPEGETKVLQKGFPVPPDWKEIK